MFWKYCVSLSYQSISPISLSTAKAEEIVKEQMYPGHSWCSLLPTSACVQGWHLPQLHISAPNQSSVLGLLNAAQTRLTQLIFLPITQLQWAKQGPTIMQTEEKTYGLNLNL